MTKNREIFGKNFHKGQIPTSDFYKIKRGGRVSQVRTLRPNFTIVTLKMWAYKLQPRKSPKLVFLGINLPKRGIYMHLSEFLHNLA